MLPSFGNECGKLSSGPVCLGEESSSEFRKGGLCTGMFRSVLVDCGMVLKGF